MGKNRMFDTLDKLMEINVYTDLILYEKLSNHDIRGYSIKLKSCKVNKCDKCKTISPIHEYRFKADNVIEPFNIGWFCNDCGGNFVKNCTKITISSEIKEQIKDIEYLKQ